MTVSWVRFGPSYGQLPQEVRQLNELARESDRFRRVREDRTRRLGLQLMGGAK